MKKRFWTSWRSTKRWCIWQKNVQGWERRSSGKFTIFLDFSAPASTLVVFSFKTIRFRPVIHQPFRGFFSLIFPTKRIFEPTVLLLKKAARCQLFLAVVRCLFHNHLRLKRSSLLNVYLNYKFEISLLTSHLFFSLFNMEKFDIPISFMRIFIQMSEILFFVK